MIHLILALALVQESAAKPRAATVVLKDTGTIQIGGAAVDWKDVDGALQKQAAEGYRALAISVDPSVPFSLVTRVMSAAKAAGIASVEFAQSGEGDFPIAREPRKVLRVKVKDGAKGLEILLLQESAATSIDDLKSQLKKLEKCPIVIDADDLTSYGLVKRIVSVCTEAGFDKVSFASGAAKVNPLRVLYAEENPRWEYRYLHNMLERSADFKLDVFLASANDEFPGTLHEFPANLSGYDVVLMGDLQRLDDVRKAALEKFVKAGGGVVWTAPENPKDWVGHDLEQICPVIVSHMVPRSTPPPETPLTARLPDHPLAKGLPWDKMPCLPPLIGVKLVDDDASTLVEWDFKQAARPPFLVTQNMGKGRSVFVAGQTWQWRAARGDQPYFAPFWTAVLKYAAGK